VRLKSDFIKVRLGYTPSLFACKREFVGGGGLLLCDFSVLNAEKSWKYVDCGRELGYNVRIGQRQAHKKRVCRAKLLPEVDAYNTMLDFMLKR
jgi:hypothetical protein